MEATVESIRVQVVNAIREIALANKDREITDDTHLINDLAFDSLDVFELSILLECAFGTTLPDGEIGKITTVLDLIHAVHTALKTGE